jgi:hypothetical protein
MKPIFVSRSVRAAPSLPDLMRERRDFIVSECSYAMPARSLGRVFESLPRSLVPGQVFLFPMLFADPVGMRGAVLQFGGALMVLVMRSVVIARGHVKSS